MKKYLLIILGALCLSPPSVEAAAVKLGSGSKETYQVRGKSAGTGETGSIGGCSTSGCQPGQQCINNSCVAIVGWCSSNANCSTGQQCVSNYCQAIPGYCTSNAQCTAPEQCISNSCRWLPGYCTADSHCASGEKCLNNSCVSSCTGVTCNQGNSCLPQQHAGQCQPCTAGSSCGCPGGQVSDGCGGCKCPTNTVWTGSSCIGICSGVSCRSGFTPTAENDQCVCKSSCGSGQVWHPTLSKCVEAICPSNCANMCDAGYCTSCNSGYYLNSNGMCSSCGLNCKTCSSGTSCTLCNPGFVLSGGSCVRDEPVFDPIGACDGRSVVPITCGSGLYRVLGKGCCTTPNPPSGMACLQCAVDRQIGADCSCPSGTYSDGMSCVWDGYSYPVRASSRCTDIMY